MLAKTSLHPRRRLYSAVLLTASICAASACADTENRFIAAKLTGPAAGAPAEADPEPSTSSEKAHARTTDDPESKPPATPAASSQPSRAANAVVTGQAGTPAAQSGMTHMQASAAGAVAQDDLDAGSVNPEDSTACSVELTGCVLLNGAKVDGCLDDFSKCRGVLAKADGGPESACALQLTSCVLADATNTPACDERYQACVKAIP